MSQLTYPAVLVCLALAASAAASEHRWILVTEGKGLNLQQTVIGTFATLEACKTAGATLKRELMWVHKWACLDRGEAPAEGAPNI
ncbi:hypothetical protein ACFODL_06485 [Phenylobacterium terrae]|uniref:UrcA family protein n=1 Tax=Phenylobacterium terrae TaxID=2665495 RepID=A0ABW4NA03_9CAUL